MFKIKLTKPLSRFLARTSLALSACLCSYSAQATIVQFETVLGNFEVNLYDQGTPKTVANFLNYVQAENYTNVIIHRSINNFVIQGGGFTYNGGWPPVAVPQNPTVDNEPKYSNVKGTISMAKIGGQPNSATNQWFFNLKNNTNLDSAESGYTVFGEVTGDGMAIIEQIAGLQVYNALGELANLPLQNYSGSGLPDETNLVIINKITVIDSATDTAASLNPPLNNSSPTTPTTPTTPSSSGGGGSLGGLFMLILGICHLRRRQR